MNEPLVRGRPDSYIWTNSVHVPIIKNGQVADTSIIGTTITRLLNSHVSGPNQNDWDHS